MYGPVIHDATFGRLVAALVFQLGAVSPAGLRSPDARTTRNPYGCLCAGRRSDLKCLGCKHEILGAPWRDATAFVSIAPELFDISARISIFRIATGDPNVLISLKDSQDVFPLLK